MPKKSDANFEIKLSYINGHYCCALKTSSTTNALGLIRDFDFFEKFDLDIANSTTANDAKSLIPTLDKFFSLHNFNYKYLYKDHNIIPIFPLRRASALPTPRFTKDGIIFSRCISLLLHFLKIL